MGPSGVSFDLVLMIYTSQYSSTGDEDEVVIVSMEADTAIGEAAKNSTSVSSTSLSQPVQRPSMNFENRVGGSETWRAEEAY